MINAGDMRHRITLQHLNTGKDSDGFVVDEWQDLVSVWAAVQNLSGREFFEAAAVQMEQSLRFVIRYRKGITQDMRIAFRGELYGISSIDNNAYQNTQLILLASRIEKERDAVGGQ